MVLGCDVEAPSDYAKGTTKKSAPNARAPSASARELSSREPGTYGYAKRDKEAMVAQGDGPHLEDDW